MKRVTNNGVQVLPALYGRTAATSPGRAIAPVQPVTALKQRLTFEHRATRPSRFPLEQALARIPEPPRLGRFLDIEV